MLVGLAGVVLVVGKPDAPVVGIEVLGIVGVLVVVPRPGLLGVRAGVLWVVVVTLGLLDVPARSTRAQPRTPNESTITIVNMTNGARQLAGAESRVRAAPPQCRHQSCCAASTAPHRGHADCVWGG